ncbi:MAG TPA: CapA family protein [Gemmatimonadales bacterium]|nr:CapA family protein [Gemmatimonadales bacterium]
MPAPTRLRSHGPVHFAFVGDINLGTTTFDDGLPPDSGRSLLRAAAPYLKGDLVVGNFEGVLADSGTSSKCEPNDSVPAPRHPPRRLAHRHASQPARAPCFVFRTPTWLAPRLAEAGFTDLNLANNHANDFGLDGRTSTEATLAASGLATYGPLGSIAIDTVARGDSSTIVGVVGFTTYPFAYDLLDIPRSAAVVDSVRPLVDVLVVTFHGGAEGVGAQHVPDSLEFLGREPRGELRAWAHAVIDAGADAVIGHGPHVLRGVEFYRRRPIAYSLGNFATFRGFNLRGPLGVTGVLQLTLGADGGFLHARLVPMRQLPSQGPAPDPDAAALRLVRELSAEDFGAAAARVNADGAILAPEASDAP